MPRQQAPRSVSKEVPIFVRLNGWYYSNGGAGKGKDGKEKVSQVDLTRSLISDEFVHTIRRFNADDLEITQTKRLQGSFWNPTHVRAVVDLSNPGLPFFIKEEDVAKLEPLVRGKRRYEALI